MYYREKFGAALQLAMFARTPNASLKNDAVQALQRARDWWTKLGSVWSQHYLPYFMARTKHTFGYPLYNDQVERDIELAKAFNPNPSDSESYDEDREH